MWAVAFAVVAGNLGLRNRTELDFLWTEAFLSLKCAINKHVLEVTDIDQPAGDLIALQPTEFQPTQVLKVEKEKRLKSWKSWTCLQEAFF